MKESKTQKMSSGDPYGIRDSRIKSVEKEERLKAVEDALIESAKELKDIRSKIDKIESVLSVKDDSIG